jgi:selenocysteine-specific elongation factor
VVAADDLVAAGFTTPPVDARRIADWWVDPVVWEQWLRQLPDVVRNADALSGGVPLEAARRAVAGSGVAVPDVVVMAALVAASPGLQVRDGRVRAEGPSAADPPELAELLDRLAGDPFAAPDGSDVQRIGAQVLAFGAREGRLLNLGGGVFVAPDAPRQALERLRELPQPFTVSAARQALASSRRVVVPLLEHLDAARKTRRLEDGRRAITASSG